MVARPIKQGLDYFSLDVGFFDDLKIRRIKKDCGNQSIPILISILCSIYREEGYYVGFNGDLSFLIAEQFGVSEGAVLDTVRKAVEVEFFDGHMFHTHSILTSKGIQKRFFEAATLSKRKEVKYNATFMLISVNSYNNLVNVCNNSINSVNNPQSKVKESKVKESKEKNIGQDKPASMSSFLDSLNLSDELRKRVVGFIEMRKTIKKPLTVNGLDLMLNKLSKLSEFEEEQIEILENSIMNCWQSVYPLKGDDKKSSGYKSQLERQQEESQEYSQFLVNWVEKMKREEEQK